MGLRPSVKNEGDQKNSDDSRYREPSPHQSSQLDENVNNSQPSPSSYPSSSTTRPPHQKTPLKPPQREAWTARGQLLLNFHDVISRAINSPEMVRKCSQIAEDVSDAESDTATALYPASDPSKTSSTNSSSNSIQEYSAEANLIVENKSKRDSEVRKKSLALGILTFCSLRSFPLMRQKIFSYFQTYSTGMRTNYKFDLHPPSLSTSKNNDTIPPKSFFRKSLRFTFDTVFSTSITLLSGTFLFMPSPASYIDDMSKLPLVEGKSVYAEMVCPPLMKEYGHVLMEYGGRWPVKQIDDAKGRDEGGNTTLEGRKNATITQEDVSLNVIRDFVVNCSKRHKYEQGLVEERNLLASASKNDPNISGSWWKRGGAAESSTIKLNGDDRASTPKLGTVAIPSPGVPDDLEIDLDQEVLSFMWDEEYVNEKN
ncbi:hypothetical protein ACHAXS_003327 [Conticribra weissflogii]